MRTIIATALAGLLAWPAAAEELPRGCCHRSEGMAALAQRYGETRHVMALNADGRVFELLGNMETGTWTAVLTSPAGVSCTIGSGEMFTLTDDPLPPQGEEG